MELLVQPYRKSQSQEVIGLWHRCGLVTPRNDPLDDIGRKLAFQPELFLVGTVDGRVTATVMVGYEGHRGWINYLAVDPGSQGHGLGRRMLEHAERTLAELGCAKVNLQVRLGNLEVLGFYEALGYAQDEVVSMGKRL